MKLRELIEQVRDKQEEMNLVLARQEEHLKHHIKRTDLLEEQFEKHQSEFKPVQRHVELVNAFAKLIVLGGSLAAVLRLFLS